MQAEARGATQAEARGATQADFSLRKTETKPGRWKVNTTTNLCPRAPRAPPRPALADAALGSAVCPLAPCFSSVKLHDFLKARHVPVLILEVSVFVRTLSSQSRSRRALQSLSQVPAWVTRVSFPSHLGRWPWSPASTCPALRGHVPCSLEAEISLVHREPNSHVKLTASAGGLASQETVLSALCPPRSAGRFRGVRGGGTGRCSLARGLEMRWKVTGQTAGWVPAAPL